MSVTAALVERPPPPGARLAAHPYHRYAMVGFWILFGLGIVSLSDLCLERRVLRQICPGLSERPWNHAITGLHIDGARSDPVVPVAYGRMSATGSCPASPIAMSISSAHAAAGPDLSSLLRTGIVQGGAANDRPVGFFQGRFHCGVFASR